MRRRGEPFDFEATLKTIVMKSVERLREYMREELANALDSLEPFRGDREDEEPFVRRRPGRPRKVVVEARARAEGQVLKKTRRPRGRKKLIREAAEFLALKKRLDRPELPNKQPDPEPVPQVELEPLSYAPLVPPRVPTELHPAPHVEWDTFSEKESRAEAWSSREETRETLKLYREDRPTTRADCMTAAELANDEAWLRANPGKRPVDGKNSARPCPWVSCRQHLAINVNTSGSLQVIQDWDDGRPTCALDIVDANGPAILDKTGRFFGLTRERLRQIEAKALARAKRMKIEFEDPVEKRTNTCEDAA